MLPAGTDKTLNMNNWASQITSPLLQLVSDKISTNRSTAFEYYYQFQNCPPKTLNQLQTHYMITNCAGFDLKFKFYQLNCPPLKIKTFYRLLHDYPMVFLIL